MEQKDDRGPSKRMKLEDRRVLALTGLSTP